MADNSNKHSFRVHFSADDGSEDKYIRVLTLAGHKKNQLIKIAIEEVASKYNIDLEHIDKKTIHNFINSYDYIKNLQLQHVSVVPAKAPPSAEAPPAVQQASMPQQHIQQSSLNDLDINIDQDAANQLLSAFGI